MSYPFREIRKGERDAVLAFAKTHGCTVEPSQLWHHLSLAVEDEGQIIAAALCLHQKTGQVTIEIVADESTMDEVLISELADRCLRKVQAKDIASARLHSATEAPANAIWSQNNWLDQVQETAPPGATIEAVEPTQAA